MTTSTPGAKPKAGETARTQPTKQERLSQALRQNLQRRKAQQRARKSSADQRTPHS